MNISIKNSYLCNILCLHSTLPCVLCRHEIILQNAVQMPSLLDYLSCSLRLNLSIPPSTFNSLHCNPDPSKWHLCINVGISPANCFLRVGTESRSSPHLVSGNLSELALLICSIIWKELQRLLKRGVDPEVPRDLVTRRTLRWNLPVHCTIQLLDTVSFLRSWANCEGLEAHRGHFWKLHHVSAFLSRKAGTSEWLSSYAVKCSEDTGACDRECGKEARHL